jgi:hypothetical protein
MAEKKEKRSSVMINRAPVLTLWAAVVAEMLGFEYNEALYAGTRGCRSKCLFKGRCSGALSTDPQGRQGTAAKVAAR